MVRRLPRRTGPATTNQEGPAVSRKPPPSIGPSTRLLHYHGANYFRQRIVLSTIFRRPIRIKDICVNDVDPGLRPYEANLLRLVDRIVDGGTIKIDVTGTDLRYLPGQIIGGDDIVFDCGTERNISYFLEVLLLLGPFGKRPLRCRLRGVTHGSGTQGVRDLSVDYFRSVLVVFMKKIGLDGITVNVVKKGLAPDGGGEVEFSCPIVQRIKAFQLLDVGRIKRVRGTAFTVGVSPQFATRMIYQARRVLNDFLPDVWIYDSKSKGGVDGRAPGYGITLVAETMKGIHKGADLAVDAALQQKLASVRGRTSEGMAGNVLERKTGIVEIIQRDKELAKQDGNANPASAEESDLSTGDGNFKLDDLTESELVGVLAAQRLLLEIHYGGVIDTSYQHIPLFFMALAEEHEPCKIRLGRLAPYTIQFVRHLKDFANINFSFEESTADATGDVPGSTFDDDEGKHSVPAIPQLVVTCVGTGFKNIGRRTF